MGKMGSDLFPFLVVLLLYAVGFTFGRYRTHDPRRA